MIRIFLKNIESVRLGSQAAVPVAAVTVSLPNLFDGHHTTALDPA